MDGVIERAILRCLEKDPAQRPRTASIVASALPGGDPLAAAIAAGETPSPDMVAAAVDEQPISLPLAWISVALFACALIGTAAFARYATVDGLMPMEKQPEIVADRGQQVLRQLGYTLPAVDSVYWVSDDYRQMQYLANKEDSRVWRRKLAELYPSPTRVFYRQSPQPLDAQDGPVNTGSPSHELSGMAMVELDQRGRLRFLRVVPQRYEEAAQSNAEPDWKTLFAAAELPEASFTPVSPKWQSPVAYDARAAWEGNYGGHALHITAAAIHGRPVYFEVLGPWDSNRRSFLSWESVDVPPALMTALFSFVIPGLLWIGGIVLARRNWRTGRGDRAGAVRVAGAAFALMWLSFLLQMHHALDANEFGRLVRSAAFPSHLAALCGVLYLGLEPLARRRWPGYLVSWTRVLAGRFNNPRVGRDLLVGAAIGTLDVLIETSAHALPYWFNISKEVLLPYGTAFGELVTYVGGLMTSSVVGIIAGVTILGFLVIVTLLVRNERVALVVTFLLMLGMHASGDGNLWIGLAIGAIHSGIVFLLLLRFGLLAVVSSFICTWVLEFPLTLDVSRWYFGRSMLAAALATAITVYGFRAALAGRPMFGGDLAEE